MQLNYTIFPLLKGWAKKLGVLDFAGGLPVHIASGSAALVYGFILGERDGNLRDYKAHNIAQVVLGTSLIWFGWYGFNGGMPGANAAAALVIVVTNLSASVGGITWTLLDYSKEKRFSTLSFCFGAVSGLVGVTPASGLIRPYAGFIFGFASSLACYFAIRLKSLLKIDDALDVVAVHGIGGIVGTLLTGIFAAKEVAKYDNQSYYNDLGWVDEHWIQFCLQLAGLLATFTWSSGVTFIILFVMNKIPGLELRADDRVVTVGLDKLQISEAACERNPGV